MRFNFTPVCFANGEVLTLEKSAGNHLRINGELFNFNALNPGDTIEAGLIPCTWISGPVEHKDGHVTLTLLLPVDASPEPHMNEPEPIVVVDDGPIDVPFGTHSEVAEAIVEGGLQVTTTIYRWRQAPEVSTVFIPNAPAPTPATQLEEPADVEP